MAIPTAMFKSPLETMAKYLGCAAVEVVEQDRCKVVRAPGGQEQHFPFYLLKWEKAGGKFRVLLEPRLKLVTKGTWYHNWQQYEVNNDAMRQEVRLFLSR